jgi:N-acetylglucosaminyldiphosphoundecaprenol N-acetyl-beta-D-mannosaminyltransferase
MNQPITLLDIPIEFNKVKIFEKLQNSIQNNFKGYICTINANLIAEAFQNKAYKQILQDSIINICDGSVLAKGISWVYGYNFNSLPGPDFFLETIHKKYLKNFFLGSNQETLVGLKNNLIKINSNIKNAIFQPLPYLTIEQFDYYSISELINQNKPDIIWVSLGAPKQEIFVSRLIPFLNRGIIVSIGAAFNFYAGTKGEDRAPFTIRKLKFEWIWRLLRSPKKTLKRLKRECVILPKVLIRERSRVEKNKL